jgi:FixJ family two-component response regulator
MRPREPIVYVVDDDQSVRESLSSLIRSVGLRVETFGSAEEFLRHRRPDVPSCLVVDVHLPGSSGLDLAEAVGASGHPLPFLFITGRGTIPMSVRAMKQGAVEFLTKPFAEDELIAAIRQALVADEAAHAERAELSELQERWERLTPREREVLALVVRGQLNKNIARELGAAEQTIKVHRGRVMRKLEARSVPELVRFVERIAGQPWAGEVIAPEAPHSPTGRPGSNGPAGSVIRR